MQSNCFSGELGCGFSQLRLAIGKSKVEFIVQSTVEKAKTCLRALIVLAYRKQCDLSALHYWYYALEVPKMCHLKRILLLIGVFLVGYFFPQNPIQKTKMQLSENIYTLEDKQDSVRKLSYCELSFRSAVCNKSSAPGRDKVVLYNTKTTLPFKIFVKVR